MWISFECKLGGKVDQFWMQINNISQLAKVLVNSSTKVTRQNTAIRH
jgi:hypothetical protein